MAFAAGGPIDIIARLMGQWLSERLGQQFIVENRPGAGGNIATEAVVNSAPDGYTLLLSSPANAINATLYEKLNFNFIARHRAGREHLAARLNVMVVQSIRSCKVDPRVHCLCQGQSGQDQHGVGRQRNRTPHVTGELFKMMAGVDMMHVPYRGAGPALTDLLGGQVHVLFDNVPSAIEYIRAGRLRALGVTTVARSEALPDVPTVADFRAGLRGKCLVRHWRTEKHACRNR